MRFVLSLLLKILFFFADSKSDLPPARGCLSVFRFWTYTPEQKRNASVAAGVLLSAVGLIVFGVALSLVSQTVGDGPSTPLVWVSFDTSFARGKRF